MNQNFGIKVKMMKNLETGEILFMGLTNWVEGSSDYKIT
jgi:hypothetical protein